MRIGEPFVAATYLVCAGCTAVGDDRGAVEVDRAVLVSERTLRVDVPSCHGDPTATVTESGTEVKVRVVTSRGSRKDCLDTVNVRLAESLGSRRLVDETTGSPIELVRR